MGKILVSELPIKVGIEGWDYDIPADKPVLFNEPGFEKTLEILKEMYGFVKIGEPPKAKGASPIPRVTRRKTPIYMAKEKTQDMVVRRLPINDDTLTPDGITNGTDNDGVEWVGDGIQVEKSI